MNEFLMVVGLLLLVASLVAGLMDRRRRRAFEDFQHRHFQLKEQVERDARSRL